MYPITSQITRPITLPINDYGVGPGPSPSGYQIANSLRFRASASAYLNRTPASASNKTTWTFSAWVKRGASGSRVTLFSAGVGSGGRYAELDFENNDTIFWNAGDYTTGGSTTTNSQLGTSAVYRDFSAWYHIVFVYDTTQATASNRIKLYVNGVQATSFAIATYPSQNSSTFVNAANAHGIANFWGNAGTQQFDGYMAEINFIDGQALTPSSFGSISGPTGVWCPIKYTGTYGTNGFHLDFSNGTSTTTLGYDSSGNSNNWTTNNISLTAGSTYDWMIDSPTSYAGSSYGVGNYCVMNAASIGADCTLSNGNLGVSYGSSTSNSCTMGTIGMSSGKWYFEFAYESGSSPSPVVGLSSKSSSTDMPSYLGSNAYGWAYYNVGNKFNNGTSIAYGASWTAGDVIGIAFDADSGSLTFYKNGTSQGVAFTGLISGPYYPAVGDGGSAANFVGWFNFGQRPFAYTPPSGFKSLCTYNLSTPTIQNGAAYMDATLWAGDNASPRSITNAASFQPDFVWVKNRSSGTYWNVLFDSVRGAGNQLSSNQTDAELASASNVAGKVSAFNTNGFSLSAGSSNSLSVNGSSNNYVGWQWKASNAAAVTNTAGSITSQVSANTTAGFSVVTWTEPASGVVTIGHGLGVAPSMVIIKARASGSYWGVYHQAVGAGYYLRLNTTNAATIAPDVWNNTAPSSTVFTVGGDFNGVGDSVAYCFAAIPGYSAFGSYTGNGSSDGPFIYCGFRPRWVLIKRTDASQNWAIIDTSRDTYNVSNKRLFPNLSDAEDTGIPNFADILSNGFKLRDSNVSENASGGQYVYACFAENPFSVALAR